MVESREDERFRKSTMTFGEHLGELRRCLVKSLLGLALGFVLGMTVGKHIVMFIQQPLTHALTKYYQNESIERVEAGLKSLEQAGQALPLTAEEARRRVEEEHLLADEVFVDPAQLLLELKALYPERFKDLQALPTAEASAAGDKPKMIRLFTWHRSEDDIRMKSRSLGALEGFGIWVKTSLLFGIIVASPWIIYQIWQFVAAGLYPHERQYVHAYLPFSIALFLLGAALAFFVVFGPGPGFSAELQPQHEHPARAAHQRVAQLRVDSAGRLRAGLQLPLAMLFMERIGLFTVKSYLAQWRVAVLVIFVIAGILMPPDPYSMLLNAGALSLLYFGGILLCKYLPRRPI